MQLLPLISSLRHRFHAPARSIVTITHPDSTLINGRGRYVGGPAAPLSVITVEKGKRYRMRLISMSCDANHVFKIDGHTDFKVIETDGIATETVVADQIHIFAGQRYSFVLNANKKVGNYWIRAQPNIGPEGYEGGTNLAILRYKGASETDPTTSEVTPTAPLVEAELAPLENPAAPGIPQLGAADVNLRIEVGVNFDPFLFTMNGIPYQSPPTPILLQILNGATNVADLLPHGTIYMLPRNKVIEITVVSLDLTAPVSYFSLV